MQITINCSQETGKLRPFWASTGFTPATLLLTNDMRQQLMYFGSVPRHGINYVRIHYLLELVSATFEGETPASVDWSRLDHGLDLLVENGLTPVFEIMGNPDGQFTDFRDDLQLRRFRALIAALAAHVTERYGQAEVERWVFETWNEPDIGFGWNHQWPQDTESFCNYYDACVEGLASVNPRLTIGGPGSCRTLSQLFRDFMAHCDSGKNYFTGETGVRLDFISVHEKGIRPNKEDLTPRTAAMIGREADIIRYIQENHPRLANTRFVNDECDPIVGWKDIHTWHARPYYSAWVCKSLLRHLVDLQDNMGVDYWLLSNDHGFIGEWGNRTLLARFGQGDWIKDGQSGHASQRGWAVRDFSTPNFAMIAKPVFTVKTLLSLLGETRLAASTSGALAQPANDADLGVLATRTTAEGAVAVLVYYSRDRLASNGSEQIELTLENLPFDRAMLAHYRIDEEHSDPFVLWEEAIGPAMPDDNLLAAMREKQEAALLEPAREVAPANGCLSMSFELPLHGVSLLILQPKPDSAPQQVTGLRAETFAGLNETPETLLVWKALDSRAVKTYEVLRADTADGSYQRVNVPDLLNSAFMHPNARGWYKVAAVDFWGRKGQPSQAVEVK